MDQHAYVDVCFDAHGKTSRIRSENNFGILRDHLNRHPPFAKHIRSRIFSYGPGIQANYESALSKEFDLRGFRHCLGIFSHLHSTDIDYETRFGSFKCECLDCSDSKYCGREILDLSIGVCSIQEAYEDSEDERYGSERKRTEKSPRKAGKKSLYSGDLITFPETVLPGGTLASATLKMSLVKIRMIYSLDEKGLGRFEAFRFVSSTRLQKGSGQTQLYRTPIEYVVAELKLLNKSWNDIIRQCKDLLFVLSGEVLDDTFGDMDRNRFHNLVRYAQIWGQFYRIQQQQIRVFQEMFFDITEENKIWFGMNQALENNYNTPRNSGSAYPSPGEISSRPSFASNSSLGARTNPTQVTPTRQQQQEKCGPQAAIKAALDELDKIGQIIEKNLVQETRELIERTHNIISINEAYRSRYMNESIKRLSWVTFVFLPLLFVASLFGMNIDILQNNPSWTYYLILSVPMFFLIMVFVYVLKEWKRIKRLARAPRGLVVALKNLIVILKSKERLGTTFGRLAISIIHGERMMAISNGINELFRCVGRSRELSDLEKSNVKKRDQLLVIAARHGDLEEVRRLFHAGANVDILSLNRDGPTALQAAAERGHRAIVERLIKYGAFINAPAGNIDGRTALQAAAGKHPELVELLLHLRADVNAPPGNINGRTALQAAAGGGYLEIFEILVKYGASINAPPGNIDGRTALQAAAEGGHREIAEKLIQLGAAVNEWNNGHTALKLAAGRGHKDVVELLIGSRANVRDMEGFIALQAAAGGGYPEIVETLIKNQAPINHMNSGGVLWAAAYGGHREVVEILIREKADVNAIVPGEVSTALAAAAERGHKDIIELLITNRASLSTALQIATYWGHKDIVELLVTKGVSDYDKVAALLMAATEGRDEIITLLINNGAGVDQPGSDGRTALQIAATMGQHHTVGLLIKNKANVNATPTGEGGRTALQAAAGIGQRQIVEMLINSGANVNAEPTISGGRSALQAAAEGGHLDIAQLLVREGAYVNAVPAVIGGRTALQAAAGTGRSQLVRFLLDTGADVNALPATTDGRTALQAATEGGFNDIVRLLAEKGAVANVVQAQLAQPWTPTTPGSFVGPIGEVNISNAEGKSFENSRGPWFSY